MLPIFRFLSFPSHLYSFYPLIFIISNFLRELTHTHTHTGMKMSNASLLDEATAGAEAMSMCFSLAVSILLSLPLLSFHFLSIRLLTSLPSLLLTFLLFCILLFRFLFSSSLALPLYVFSCINFLYCFFPFFFSLFHSPPKPRKSFRIF